MATVKYWMNRFFFWSRENPELLELSGKLILFITHKIASDETMLLAKELAEVHMGDNDELGEKARKFLRAFMENLME